MQHGKGGEGKHGVWPQRAWRGARGGRNRGAADRGADIRLEHAPPSAMTTRSPPGRLGRMLIALNKPYGVLSQFTPEAGTRWRTLAEFGLPAGVYPLGRLDADSEGLLLLSDEAGLNSRLLNPARGHAREYWVQVERVPDDDALQRLAAGVVIAGKRTQPARVRRLEPAPSLPPRDPPVRFRQNVPDCWLSLELTEGRNRQVRRMTAAVGHPTLRLIRGRIGALTLANLALPPGEWRELTAAERRGVFR